MRALVLAWTCLLLVIPCSAGTIYVDASASPGGDGTTWPTAYRFLQDALSFAVVQPQVDQIRIAQGIYKPTGPDGDREATFQLVEGVALYGGYAGYGEPDPDERNIELYETILSGDLNGDDRQVDINQLSSDPNRAENSFRVVTCDNQGNSSIIDGFIITGGNADGSYPHFAGGGMFNDYNSSPTVANCTFTGNSAGNGGGMFNLYYSSPTITNCTFTGNSAGSGGGMCNYYNSNPTVTDCTFSDNPAGRGGGMYNQHGSPTVTNCVFTANSASNYGGGMHNDYYSSPMVTNCTFSGNLAKHGGGMYNDESDARLTNCIFNGNWAEDNGGGMYNYESNPTVTNCAFSGNSAEEDGGGMYNYESNPTVTTCAFSGNSSEEHGGGMYNENNSSPTVISCTFSSNSAGWGGGGMKNSENCSPKVISCTFSGNSAGWGSGMYNDNSSPMVTNCTFSGNSADELYDYDMGGGMLNIVHSNPTVTGCIFSGNFSGYGGGMCNLGHSNPTVTNCTFTGNSAYYNGGVMYNQGHSSPTVTNCIFSGNEAYEGGGMYNVASNPTVTNCTFTGNSAGIHGGGMYNIDSIPTVTNSIFWENTAPNDPQIKGSSTVTYSCVQGGLSGTGNIDVDPLFIDADGADNTPGTEDDNLRLQAGSPCIDAGDNSVVTTATDLDGNPRIINGIVDMGAYESNPNTAPVAKAGDDQVVYICADGAAEVELDGSGSTDADGDELGYLWTWEIEGTLFDANGVSPIIELPAGLHTIKLTVDDGVEVSEPNWCVTEVLEGIEVNLRVMPRVINRKSHMKRILAVVQLPAGIDADDIDGSFWLYPGQIEPRFSRLMTANGSQKLFMVFDKSLLLAAVGANGAVVLEIEGQLISGRCLYGSDRIRIIRRGQGPKDQTGLRKGTRSRRNRVKKSR